jgi:hypothetical protein
MPDDEAAYPVHNPHDKFFKEAFGRPEVAREFLQTYLPSRLVRAIDWQTLKQEPASFVDERLAGSSSDLLYSARLRGEPVLLYCLFEHQSTVDADMPFRLLVLHGSHLGTLAQTSAAGCEAAVHRAGGAASGWGTVDSLDPIPRLVGVAAGVAA